MPEAKSFRASPLLAKAYPAEHTGELPGRAQADLPTNAPQGGAGSNTSPSSTDLSDWREIQTAHVSTNVSQSPGHVKAILSEESMAGGSG